MYELWGLEEASFQTMMNAMKNVDIAAIAGQSLEITDSTIQIKDGIAMIPIQGLLTKGTDSPLARLIFGSGTSYLELIRAVGEADLNAEVELIHYLVDSPGGDMNGAFDAAKAIKESKKPSVAIVSGMAASAAYLLASQADEIKSVNEADRVGSIGVLRRLFTSENIHNITSNNAPFKAPDPREQEGIDKIKEQLDMVHNLMSKVIAEGRNTDQATVNRDFGKGMLFTSDIAINHGMIDGIEGNVLDTDTPASIVGATTGFKNYEIVDVTWNSRTAQRNLREATGSQESPSKDYRNGFFWFDRKDASNVGAYKLPFVDISDGKLVAVRKAINAANAAMAGARGGIDIPEADRAAVQKHIDRYRAKIEKMDKEKQTNKGGSKMDLQAYFAEHPDGRKEHEAFLKTAVEGAVKGERSRCVAHLKNIGHSPEVAAKAIVEGTEFGNEQMSGYMNAAMKGEHGKDKGKDNPGDVTTGDDNNGGADDQNKVIGKVLEDMFADMSATE